MRTTFKLESPYLWSAEDDMMRADKIAFHRESRHIGQSDLIYAGRTGPLSNRRTPVLTPSAHSFSAVQQIHTHFCCDHFVPTLRTLKGLLSFPWKKLTMLSATRARSLAPMGKVLRAASTWSNVPAGPPDPILGMFHSSRPIRMPRTPCCTDQYILIRCYRSFQGRQGPEEN